MSDLSLSMIHLGIRLCATMLTSALLILVWMDATQIQVALLSYYAQELTTLALVPLAAGLLGSVLLEDILWYYRT